MQQAPPLPEGRLYHVFISHDWGEGGRNHAKMARVNAELKRLGLVTWFDEDRLRGDMLAEITAAIQSSALVVVVVTLGYIAKVAAREDGYCRAEFQHAVDHRTTSNIVVVVADPNAKGVPWGGAVGSRLSGHLYVDMSEEEPSNAKIGQLFDRICDRLNNPQPTPRPARPAPRPPQQPTVQWTPPQPAPRAAPQPAPQPPQQPAPQPAPRRAQASGGRPPHSLAPFGSTLEIQKSTLAGHKEWRERYFLLLDGVLVCGTPKSPYLGGAEGGLHLEDINVEERWKFGGSSSTRYWAESEGFEFEITDPSLRCKRLVLRARSEEARADWMLQLQLAVSCPFCSVTLRLPVGQSRARCGSCRSIVQAPSPQAVGEWSCPACTFLNTGTTLCRMCNTLMPTD